MRSADEASKWILGRCDRVWWSVRLRFGVAPFSKWFWSKFTLISNGFCSRKVYFCSSFMPFARSKIRLAVTLWANCKKWLQHLIEIFQKWLTYVSCEGGPMCPPVAQRECVNHFKPFQCSPCDSILLFTI